MQVRMLVSKVPVEVPLATKQIRADLPNTTSIMCYACTIYVILVIILKGFIFTFDF
jgi:hypothetical protein